MCVCVQSCPATAPCFQAPSGVQCDDIACYVTLSQRLCVHYHSACVYIITAPVCTLSHCLCGVQCNDVACYVTLSQRLCVPGQQTFLQQTADWTLHLWYVVLKTAHIMCSTSQPLLPQCPHAIGPCTFRHSQNSADDILY